LKEQEKGLSCGENNLIGGEKSLVPLRTGGKKSRKCVSWEVRSPDKRPVVANQGKMRARRGRFHKRNGAINLIRKGKRSFKRSRKVVERKKGKKPALSTVHREGRRSFSFLISIGKILNEGREKSPPEVHLCTMGCAWLYS